MRRSVMRVVCGTLVSAIVMVAPLASAQDKQDKQDKLDKKACLAAVDEGQNLRDQGKVTEAKAQFQICASRSCPAAVTKQCADWYAELEKDQPTVLFRVKDGAGKELTDAAVFVDGIAIPASQAMSGQPFPLNPGEHELRAERAGDAPATEKLIVGVGEKARLIELKLTPLVATEPPPPPPPPARPLPPPKKSFEIPLLGWVGGGVFVAGAATTTIFAILANGDESDLRDTCAPRCAQGDRDAVQTKVVIANVGLFVGLAGLAVAGVTTILANRPSSSSADTKSASASGFRVVATPGGIAGTF